MRLAEVALAHLVVWTDVTTLDVVVLGDEAVDRVAEEHKEGLLITFHPGVRVANLR